MRTALLAGATGLVGRECLDLLLRCGSFSSVTALVRRPIPGRMTEGTLRVAVVDFDHLEKHADLFSVDVAVCALGTTIHAAGSRQAFRRVDHDYPLQIARMARANGSVKFILVSALGADPASRVFYSRVKGELEEAVGALGYPALTILRPSVLLGDREEFRPGEEIMKRIGMILPLRYRPIHARRVAGAIVGAALDESAGRRIVANADLHLLPHAQ